MTKRKHPPQPIYSLEDIKRRNERGGYHWFEPASMRFFRSRVSDRIYPAADVAFFVSSECGPSGVRRYTVRRADADGSIETVGTFGEYATPGAAHGRAKREADTYNHQHGAAFRRRMRAHEAKEARLDAEHRAKLAARWEAYRTNTCTA